MRDAIEASLDLIDQRASAIIESAEARLSSATISVTGIVDDIIKKIKELIDRLLEDLRNSVAGWLKGIVDAIGGFLGNLINQVSGWIAAIADRIHSAISAIGDRIRDSISALTESVRSLASNLVSRIESLISTIANKLSSLVQRIEDLATRLAEAISGAISSLVQKIEDLAGRIARAIAEAFHQAMDRLAGMIAQIVSGVRQAVGEIIGTVINAIGNLISAIRERVAEIASAVLSGIGELAEKIRSGIEALAARIRETAEAVAEKIRTTIEELLAQILEVVQGIIKRVSQFATDALKWLQENIWRRVETALEQVKETINHKISVLDAAARGRYRDLDALISDLSDPAPGAAAIALAPVLFIMAAAASTAIGQVVAEAMEGISVTVRREFRAHFADPQSAALAAIKGTAPEGAIEAAYSAAGLSREQFNVLLGALAQYPDTSAIVASVLRGTMSPDQAEELLRKQGYVDGSLNIFLDAARAIMTPGEVLEALNRGLISEEAARGELRARGFNDAQINTILAMRFTIPGVSDLIRMMVRDAFNEEVVKRYGYDEDFPEAILEWTRKQGLPDTFTRAYWRAHWELPSPTQGFEMLHRGVISIEDLRTLLKIADYPPFWRDKLIQISYNPITRVDIRRMYRLGLLDFQDLVERYKHLGYTEEDARALAEFTAKYEQTDVENLLDRLTTRTQNAIERAYAKGKIDRQKARDMLVRIGMSEDLVDQVLAIVDFERELAVAGEDEPEFRTIARQTIMAAYADRMISRDEAKERLMMIAYSEPDAEFLLNVEDWRYAKRIRDEKVENLTIKYVEGLIDETDFVAGLTQMQLRQEEIDVIFERAQLAKERKTKRLSETTLARLLRMGIITDEEYAEELRAAGYQEKHIQWLLQSRIIPTGG